MQQYDGLQVGAYRSATPTFARARVGRLVEVRVGRLTTAADVACLNAAVFESIQGAGHGAVICADHRRAFPLTAEVASALASSMRRCNPLIARSAMLLDPSNVMYNLQLERVVRCAGRDDRRLFDDAETMHAWLAEALATDDEREALRAMLARQ